MGLVLCHCSTEEVEEEEEEEEEDKDEEEEVEEEEKGKCGLRFEVLRLNDTEAVIGLLMSWPELHHL